MNRAIVLLMNGCKATKRQDAAMHAELAAALRMMNRARDLSGFAPYHAGARICMAIALWRIRRAKRIQQGE